jgi:hypothetical protein
MGRRLAVLATIFCLTQENVYAEDWIATLQTAGRYVAVETRDSLAFFASEWGLEIFSIADPTNPHRLSTTPTAGVATDLAIDHRYAYVADSGGALLVFDCLDPTQPVLVAVDSLGLKDRLYALIGDLLRVDTILYVSVPYSDSGVYIFNIADPPNLYLASILQCSCWPDTPQVTMYDPKQFVAIDSLLYVFDYYGLWVAEISDPGHPIEVGSYRRPSGSHWTPTSAAGAADRLLLYTNDLLRQFDVSDPATPQLTTSQVPTEGSIHLLVQDLAVRDSYLILATYATGLKVASIPENASDYLQIGPFVETPGLARAVAQADSLLIVADGDGGIEIFAVQMPGADSLGYFGNQWLSSGIEFLGAYLVVGRRNGGLYVLDVSDPRDPSLKDSTLLGYDLYSLAFSGTRLFAVEVGSAAKGFNSRLLAFDVSDLLNPALLGTYISPFDNLGYSYALGLNFATDGSFTYHPDYIFSIVDVRRPDSMFLAGRVPGYFIGQGGGPLQGAGKAYAQYAGYLFVIDISNPLMPDVLNPLGSPLGYSGAVLHDTLLYETTSSGLRVVSVSDPLNVYEIGNWYSSIACGALIRRRTSLFLTRERAGVSMIDVSDPASPTLEASFDSPGYTSDLLADDSMLFVGDEYGLLIRRCDVSTAILNEGAIATPAAFNLGENYPNPFNAGTVIPFALSASSRVTHSVFNVLGQSVSTRDWGILPPGKYEIRWEAVDQAGKSLPSGVYFFRVSANEQTQVRKMLLLR